MSTYAIRRKLIEIARREVGTVEVPKDSNTGPRVKQYQAATNLGGTGWPYCAAFVCWCVREWLKLPEVLAAFKFTRTQAEAWRPKTAAAYGFHQWAADKRLLVMNSNPGNVLHTGDIMTFEHISHVGLVANDEDSLVFTVEGNTDLGGSREGGGVFEKTRQRSDARRFIRMLP